MKKQPGLTYEGLYLTTSGLIVCARLQTAGVPRFVNLLVEDPQLKPVEIDDLMRWTSRVTRSRWTPPWAEDALPGIG